MSISKYMEIQQLGGKAGVRDTDKGFKGVFQFDVTSQPIILSEIDLCQNGE